MPKLRHTKVAASRPKSAVMASLDLASFYSPGRGIGYSVVIHAVLLTVVQLLAIIHIPPHHIPTGSAGRSRLSGSKKLPNSFRPSAISGPSTQGPPN